MRLNLETLMPWILIVKIFEFETIYYEEIVESIIEFLLQIQNRNTDISELYRRLKMNDINVNDHSIWTVDEDGLLRKDDKIYILQNKIVKYEIIKINHDNF